MCLVEHVVVNASSKMHGPMKYAGRDSTICCLENETSPWRRVVLY